MLRTSLIVAFCLALPAYPTDAAETAERSMAVTFDDLPAQRAQHLPEERIEEITRGIVGTLATYRIPAVGFVNEDKLDVAGGISPARVALLERWLDAGLELGNHTYSHPDLHHVTRAEFEQSILDGERVLRPLLAQRDQELRWFRHPFLHTGRDLETRDAVHTFLAEHGYRAAPVTVDNSEWIFARAYDEALDRVDDELAKKLGASYVDYMTRMVTYYEDQSRQLFEREIPQVLLVHANALNAEYFDELVAMLKERGYDFVSLDETLEDPAYRSADTFTGAGGITWLHRWAITRGADPAMFRGEPTTPEWVQELAGIRE